MQKHKNFWVKNADRYDRFMRKERAAYEEMYDLLRPVVRHKTVLELASGTGLIARRRETLFFLFFFFLRIFFRSFLV